MEDETYQRAKKRVEAIRGFYEHFVAYIIVNAGLFIIDLLTSPDSWWFYWPLVAWGVGLVFHAVSVFLSQGMLGRDWEERQIQKFMQREQQRSQRPED